MQQWTDLFLNMPLPESWMKALLFITFGLHLLFVLLMLGTALLSLKRPSDAGQSFDRALALQAPPDAGGGPAF